MTAATSAGRALDDLSRLSRDQSSLSVLIVLTPLATLACAVAAGAEVDLWLVILVLAVGAACVARPDGHSGLALTGILAWHWATAVNDPATAWVLPAALAVLTLHTAIAAASTVPGPAALDRVARRRWARHWAWVAGVTTVAWGVTAAARAAAPSGNAPLTIGAMLTVGATAWWLRRRGQPMP